MSRILILSCALLITATGAYAQASFEVASVKPMGANGDEPMGASFRIEPGSRLLATGATLRDLVTYAFEVQHFQLEGGEDWMSSSRFDVTARAADGTASHRQIRGMLQSLLADRFRLRVRRDTRTLPVYELMVAANDRRLGPGLRPATGDCTAALDGRAVLDISRVAPEHVACQPEGKFVAGPTTTMAFVRKGVTMPLLARMLTSLARRAVIDRTGLAGAYDFELTYSPENVIYVVKGGPIQTAGATGDGLSLFTALREQLGLELESGRGPSDVLAIEGAQPPEPD
jgi:uncharacterized protein (TIGR03435 family)